MKYNYKIPFLIIDPEFHQFSKARPFYSDELLKKLFHLM